MTLDYEFTQRELDAMAEETRGNSYQRIHCIAERALFGRFEVALRLYGVK